MNTSEPVIYEVWGWDTFSSESYLCGRYDSLDEAQTVMANLKAETWKHQDEGLRDSFSIREITPSEIETREKEWEERQAYERIDRAYSRTRLEENIATLAHKLSTIMSKRKQKEPRSFTKEAHTTLHNPGDCIKYLAIGIRWNKAYGRCLVRYAIKINCKTVRSTSWTCEMGTPFTLDQFQAWLTSPSAPTVLAKAIDEDLEKEFYRSI